MGDIVGVFCLRIGFGFSGKRGREIGFLSLIEECEHTVIFMQQDRIVFVRMALRSPVSTPARPCWSY